MSVPTREEINRELAENRGGKIKPRLDYFYPPEFERQDREQEAEDEARCDYCDELPDDCQCH